MVDITAAPTYENKTYIARRALKTASITTIMMAKAPSPKCVMYLKNSSKKALPTYAFISL